MIDLNVKINKAPHSWGFLFIKWFNFHYRYTGKVSFIEDSEPALGAGGREFESLHPDTYRDVVFSIIDSEKRS